MAQRDLESMGQGQSTEPADLGVPLSAFAARNAVQNPVIDVANQHRERPRISQSHSVAKEPDVSLPPVKKQRLDYNQKQRPRQGEVQDSASTGAAGTVRLTAVGLKRKYDSMNVLTASDDDIKHQRPLNSIAQTERQTRTQSEGEEFGSGYGNEVETDMCVRCFS